MMQKIKDLLKHYLKRRSKITEASIIVFLITGSIGYSQTVDETSPKIIVSDNDTILTITETGVIDGSESIGTGLIIDDNGNIGIKEESGNGIIVNPEVTGTRIENAGKIKGSIIGKNDTGSIISNTQGNGVFYGAVGTNTGIISGNVDVQGGTSTYTNTNAQAKKSGNGVLGTVGTNTGIISGSADIQGGTSTNASAPAGAQDSGNGVVYGTVGTNTGIISGNVNIQGGTSTNTYTYTSAFTYNSGNGVLGTVGTNTGIISGSADIQGGTSTNASADAQANNSGNGVLGTVGTNTGIISGSADIQGGTSTNASAPAGAQDSGNGVVYGTVGTNTGIISGNVNIQGGTSTNAWTEARNSGNGVYGIVGTNTGIISGSAYVQGGTSTYAQARNSGNGVYRGVMTNTGIISGNVNIQGGTSTNVYAHYSGFGVRAAVGTNTGIISGNINVQGGTSASASAQDSGYGVWDGVGTNTGIISGNAYVQGGTSTYAQARNSGNGVYGAVVKNTGIISGNAYAQATTSGNGVLGVVGTNTGIISGNVNIKGETSTYAQATTSGNGVYGSMLENNSGLIRGYAAFIPGTKNGEAGEKKINFSGNGVAYGRNISIQKSRSNFNYEIISKISNNGTIMGSESAVAANGINSIINYGVLAGQQIYGNGSRSSSEDEDKDSLDIINPIIPNSVTEHGVHVMLDESGSVLKVTNFDSTKVVVNNKTIMNTALKNGGTDSYDVFTSDISNKIINGAGVGSGVVTVSAGKSIDIDNSIINGYDTAVTIRDGSALTASNTIFNGGTVGKYNNNGTTDNILDDYMEYHPVIAGTDGDNTLSIKGNSVVNGDIDLGKGNDNLVVSNTVQLNGDLRGGEDVDILQLGDGTTIIANYDVNGDGKIDKGDERGLSIFGKIEGFEDILVKGQVTLYETAEVRGEEILIDSNSSLNLRIDPTKKDDGGRIIGHALYGSNGNLIVTKSTVKGVEYNTYGGALNIITNGLGVGGVIAMSDDKENRMKVDGYVRTDSIITSAELNENEDIKITVMQDLDEVILAPVDPVTPKPKVTIKYPKLDLVYKSIVSSGDLNINALYPTVGEIDNETAKTTRAAGGVDNEAAKTARAAGGVSKTSADAKEELLALLNDIFAENPYGYVSYSSKESMDIFSNLVLNNSFKPNAGGWMIYGGATYANFDEDYNVPDTFGDTDLDSDIYGGYALGEYGISKNSSVGVLIGGTNSKTNISNGSKLEGDSFYVGTYGKTEINNFRLKAGIGYQYTDYDTRRVSSDKYQYEKYEDSMKTNGLSAYAGAVYTYELGKSYFLEPKWSLTYTRIDQDSVDEGKEALAIEADSESINYLDTEIGIDLVKELRLNESTVKIKGGISYLYALDGADKDYITGRMDGGSDFDILVPERDKDMVKIGASFEGEQENGFIYNVGGGYITASDIDEYYVGTGIGFKFDNVKDLIPEL